MNDSTTGLPADFDELHNELAQGIIRHMTSHPDVAELPVEIAGSLYANVLCLALTTLFGVVLNGDTEAVRKAIQDRVDAMLDASVQAAPTVH